jgi:hypothetical protein
MINSNRRGWLYRMLVYTALHGYYYFTFTGRTGCAWGQLV